MKVKRSLKAVLLSGFVFPGLGQLYLKRYRRGITIIFLVLVGLAIIIGMTTISTLKILKEIQIRGGTVDMATVSAMAVASSSAQALLLHYKVCFLFIVGCWLFSIIDACKTGKGD